MRDSENNRIVSVVTKACLRQRREEDIEYETKERKNRAALYAARMEELRQSGIAEPELRLVMVPYENDTLPYMWHYWGGVGAQQEAPQVKLAFCVKDTPTTPRCRKTTCAEYDEIMDVNTSVDRAFALLFGEDE